MKELNKARLSLCIMISLGFTMVTSSLTAGTWYAGSEFNGVGEGTTICQSETPIHQSKWAIAPGLWQYFDEFSGINADLADESSCIGESYPCFASISGIVTSNLVCEDHPWATMWVKLTARAKWQGGVNVSPNSVQVYNGLGGTYSQTYTEGQGWYGGIETHRWMYVDSSSGLLTMEVPLGISIAASASDVDSLSARVWAGFTDWQTSPPASERPNEMLNSPWSDASPTFPITPTFYASMGGTQSGGDPVDLATGTHLYLAFPDIRVYNPVGPSAYYQRNYIGTQAKVGYASPGLSEGWADNYDVTIQSLNPSQWDTLRIMYPNGSTEDFTSPIQNGAIWEFCEPEGSPYFVEASPSTTTGIWDSMKITWHDQTVWTFEPVNSAGNDLYKLATIGDRVGHYISIIRDNNYRVTSITDDSSPATTLMTFYDTDSDGRLDYIIDAYGRKVVYSFGSSYGSTCLLSVSQMCSSSSSNPEIRESFTYGSIGGSGYPLVTEVKTPSPTGSGLSVHKINYGFDELRWAYVVTSLEDPNLNKNVFTYKYNNGTLVETKNPQGETEASSTANYDTANGNSATGTTDSKGYNTSIFYEDSNNPTKPTKIIDRKLQITEITYDDFGNVLTVNTPRGTVTTYTYDYNDFPLGRLTSVQEGDKPATTFTYYEPNGLVHTITGPEPGTTGGQDTVTTTFTYDSLGNVLTKVSPGNNATSTITTTYNYTQDGVYTQPAKIGQPLTITDQLGHATHLRYDARGNLTQGTDNVGNTTSFMYNIADQLSDIIHPVVP